MCIQFFPSLKAEWQAALGFLKGVFGANLRGYFVSEEDLSVFLQCGTNAWYHSSLLQSDFDDSHLLGSCNARAITRIRRSPKFRRLLRACAAKIYPFWRVVFWSSHKCIHWGSSRVGLRRQPGFNLQVRRYVSPSAWSRRTSCRVGRFFTWTGKLVIDPQLLFSLKLVKNIIALNRGKWGKDFWRFCWNCNLRLFPSPCFRFQTGNEIVGSRCLVVVNQEPERWRIWGLNVYQRDFGS